MKKRLNKKGFTLVELLATVVILLTISTVAITSISASIDRQNEKKAKATEELIISYARLYIEERVNQSIDCVNVSTLISTYGLDTNTLKNDGYVQFSIGDGKYTYYGGGTC